MVIFIASSVQGQPTGGLSQDTSPCLSIKSDGPRVDQLPLKSTSADVKVIGVIADIIVTQVHKNGVPRESPYPQKPYPPLVGEIRRSMMDRSLKEFLSEVNHSFMVKAVASCVGG
jgi:hypothetical protein